MIALLFVELLKKFGPRAKKAPNLYFCVPLVLVKLIENINMSAEKC